MSCPCLRLGPTVSFAGGQLEPLAQDADGLGQRVDTMALGPSQAIPLGRARV